MQRKYPTVVVDNFFTNPDMIRKFALSLPYAQDPNGRWPGERTPMLHTINENIVYSMAKKILSVYYDMSTQVFWDSIQMAFHKIKPYSNEEYSSLNDGWVHVDGSRTLAGVVYLTPNINENTGTSIYGIKKEHIDYDVSKVQKNKDILYKNKTCDKQKYENELNLLNSKFNKITEVKNIYNRCILYDAHDYHSGSNYYSKKEDRLSLIFFFTNLNAGISPKERIMYFDKELECDILKVCQK